MTGNIEKHKREIRLSHLSETTLIVESSICPQIVRKIIEYRNKAVLFHFILDWSLEVEDKASHGSMNVNPCVSKVSQLQPTSPDLCSPLFGSRICHAPNERFVKTHDSNTRGVDAFPAFYLEHS